MIFKTSDIASADDELVRRHIYDEIFRRLHAKVKNGTSDQSSFVFHPELNLGFVLRNQDKIIDIIISSIKQDQFDFEPIKHSVIISDKPRDIYIADWPERILMLALGKILTDRLKFMISENVYSFQKGRGSHNALQDASTFIRRQKKRPLYVLKRDVSKYGDSIPQPKLFAALEIATDIRDCPLFYKLLKAAIRVPYRKKNSEAAASLCVGVPSGSPLVPPLENFYLTSLDRKFLGIKCIYYGRYGDDILFITSDRTLADWAREQISTTVSNLGLEIKPQKMIDASLGYCRSEHDNQYDHRTHIAWLGCSLTNHGLVGIKQNHLDVVLKSLDIEISGLFRRSKRANISVDDQVMVLKNGLDLLLKKNAPNTLSSYIYSHSDHLIYKLIDRTVTRMVFRCLTKEFGLKKKSAWRVLRSLKIPSTYHQRFLERRRKIRAKKSDKNIKVKKLNWKADQAA